MKYSIQFKNLFHPLYIFREYIHILFIRYILLSGEILLIPKIMSQNAKKNASEFFKKKFAWKGLKPHHAQHIYSKVKFKR